MHPKHFTAFLLPQSGVSASTCSSPWHLSIAEHFELFCLPFQLPPSDVFSALCPHLSLFLLGWLKHTAWAPGAAMGEQREQKCCMDVITENTGTRDKVQKRFGMKCRTGAFTPENSGPCTEARHCQGGCISAGALPVGRCPGEVTEAGWLISSSLLSFCLHCWPHYFSRVEENKILPWSWACEQDTCALFRLVFSWQMKFSTLYHTEQQTTFSSESVSTE